MQHHLAFEAELPDEGRHEASVEVRAWPVPIRSTGVARNRPWEVDGNHRPELSQVRNEVDPHACAAGHRGHEQVNRCVGSRSRIGLRADIVHRHAAHARRHAAQPRPLLRPDAPVVVSHGDPPAFPMVLQRMEAAITLSDGSSSIAYKMDRGWYRGPVREAVVGPAGRHVECLHQGLRLCAATLSGSIRWYCCVIVAVHPWDTDGAQGAGLASAWINRGGGSLPAVFRAPTIEALLHVPSW